MIIQKCIVLCFKSMGLADLLQLAPSHDQVMHGWSDKAKWKIHFIRRKV